MPPAKLEAERGVNESMSAGDIRRQQTIRHSSEGHTKQHHPALDTPGGGVLHQSVICVEQPRGHLGQSSVVSSDRGSFFVGP